MINLKCNNKSKIIYFNISFYERSISLKYNIIELKYFIHVFDENKKRIKPFDLSFYYDLHIFCVTKIKNNNGTVKSFPNFNDNMNLICTEQLRYSDVIELGIKIYKKKDNIHQLISTIYYFNNKNFNLLELKMKNDDDKFSPIKIQNDYINLFNEINCNKTLSTLKASYFQNISFNLKIKLDNEDNIWKFKNIYNQYYCFCKGIKCKKNTSIFQNCKYLYYLYIIDKFRDLYDKTEYLLADFILTIFNDDDILPIFRQMIKQNISAHYMTPKIDIYNEYCFQKEKCWTIIKENFINGDFLEKYLYLLLKLKITIAGSDFPAINNIFYNIEYITSINIGHGVKFFKSFLYKDYTSQKKYNKLVLAPSSKLISIAKKYGWKDENIIKLCLPKWDKYNNSSIIKNDNKSIFIFFTWRDMNPHKSSTNKEILGVSELYINNILNLLNDTKLIKHFAFVKIINNKMISNYLFEIKFNNKRFFISNFRFYISKKTSYYIYS